MANRDDEILKKFEAKSAATAIMAGNAFQGHMALDIMIGLRVELARKMGIVPAYWPDDQILLLMHKYRYECKQATNDQRLQSRSWLEERGMHRLHMLPWPEGDLPDET